MQSFTQKRPRSPETPDSDQPDLSFEAPSLITMGGARQVVG